MKKLKLKLDGKELSKDQMKKINGGGYGDPTCNALVFCAPCHHPECPTASLANYALDCNESATTLCAMYGLIVWACGCLPPDQY